MIAYDRSSSILKNSAYCKYIIIGLSLKEKSQKKRDGKSIGEGESSLSILIISKRRFLKLKTSSI